MHISEVRDFIAAALDDDQIDFDDKGVGKIDTDNGIVMVFNFTPPTLRLYCSPFSAEEYDEIEDKAAFLESLLAINYESDIGSRQAFKMGFNADLAAPVVAADMDVDRMQAETLRTIYDDLNMIADIVRKTVMGDDFEEEEDESLETANNESQVFDGDSLRL